MMSKRETLSDDEREERALRLDPSLTRIDGDAFVAPDAVVLGDVRLGPGASVWFKAVIRGDTESIEIGPGSNVQDHCTLHADPGYPCRLGRGVTVGHRAIVHGATVEDGAMVGMGAIVMNGAVVGAGAILGAGALLPEGKEVPPGTLAVGVPARVVRELTDEERRGLERSAEHYEAAGRRYRDAGYGQP